MKKDVDGKETTAHIVSAPNITVWLLSPAKISVV
jgi:hypothetical protein